MTMKQGFKMRNAENKRPISLQRDKDDPVSLFIQDATILPMVFLQTNLQAQNPMIESVGLGFQQDQPKENHNDKIPIPHLQNKPNSQIIPGEPIRYSKMNQGFKTADQEQTQRQKKKKIPKILVQTTNSTATIPKP